MNLSNAVRLAKEQFYWFHRHPELSQQEFETTTRIKAFLEAHHIEIYDTDLPTGVVAHVGHGEPVVAIRCDIDALPMEEKTDLPYKSEIVGRMHACGHDFHAATLLGIALILKDKEQELHGTVKLIFQPAEENATGAKEVLQTGILEDADVIFGLHCSAVYPRGTIITREGFMNGAVDTFRFIFHGKGAHACRPFMSIDPVIMVSHFVQIAQTVISRNLDPFHAALVSITHIGAGSADNIIPEEGFAAGTVRSLLPEDRSHIKERLLALAEGAASEMGGSVSVIWHEGPPATNNTKVWSDFAKETALKLKLPFALAPDSLSGEDFAFYQQKIPGAFIQIGTGISPMNHNPAFRVDPETLHESILFGSSLASEALDALQKGGHSD